MSYTGQGSGASPSDSSVQKSAYSRTGLLKAGIPLGIGLLISTAGIAQTVAGVFQAAAQRRVDSIDWSARVFARGDVTPAIEDFAQANSWWPDPLNDFNNGVMEAQLAVETNDAGQKEILISAASSQLEQSLAMAPADAAAWTWLAYARLLKQGPSPPVIDALSMSIELARFDPSLVALRCQVGLLSYKLLSGERKERLDDQIRILAQVSTADLVKVARRTNSLRIVMSVLIATDHTGSAQRFQDMLGWVR